MTRTIPAMNQSGDVSTVNVMFRSFVAASVPFSPGTLALIVTW